ncbi:hypothetical protein AU210_016474 [Fusarium oxysporum f. sp. radicis-cucumerinum]|uniref:DUF7918 domain-containing protein n=1 Tax=Fusarium oxysporum f. sp. radicis-cucumerinum TaxID=327505 RepID=A0A2H3G792_FUSOX|nr:hypothetical protein AU210_016474 [Fusarium oxysporum f. sp. radicis-cucumerinum]
MAIIKKVPEISVSIAIEGKEADEYDPCHEKDQAQDEVPTVRRYIQAQSGSKYSISYRISPNFQFKNGTDMLGLHIYVDGSHFHSKYIRESDLGGSECCGQVPSRHTKRQEQVEALVFSPVQPIEDASRKTVDEDVRRVKRMGSIQIVVNTWKAELIEDLKPSNFPPSRSPYVAQKALSKSSRGVTHTTLYKTFRARKTAVFSRYIRLTNKHKVSVFKFRYASRESIERQCIKLNGQAPDRATSDAYKVTKRLDGKEEIDLTGLE